MSGTRRVFPATFKREAVDRVATSGLSVGTARELGLHETVLRRWMMQFGVQATGTARRPTTQAPAHTLPSEAGEPGAQARSAFCSTRRRAATLPGDLPAANPSGRWTRTERI